VAALAREARRAGLSYITDTTSQQVLELAVRHRPAVIILDLKQHVDGRDLLAALKRDPRTRDIKVLVLSAIEDQFTRHVCLELGADDYDVKPFDPSFMSKVARLAGAGERH
jgi:CheY-like chemotaxis protein